MNEPLSIEPTGASDFGPCECCGSATRRVWGLAHAPDRDVAAYFVQWAVGRVGDHGALFDLVLGRWSDGTTAADRVLVTLDYRLTDTGPAFMVIDAAGRPAAESELLERALSRAEVIGQPVAQEAFAVADAVLEQDARIAELLGQYRITPRRQRPRWMFWK